MRFLKHELSRARVVRFRMVRHIESEKMRQIAEKGEKGGKLEGPTSKKKRNIIGEEKHLVFTKIGSSANCFV